VIEDGSNVVGGQLAVVEQCQEEPGVDIGTLW
jgi:hypothetical protein